MNILEPDGRAISYIDEGQGPAVVLLPASGWGVSYLGMLAAALTAEDFRVVRIGTRRSPEAAASMHDLAQDVVDVMDALGLDDAWIGGHAFGGAVARTVSLDHTDRVNGVLLLGVTTPETVADAAVPTADEAEELDRIGARFDAEVASAQHAGLASTPAAEWAELATGVPVLVIQGTDDPVTPPANGVDLQASAPDRVSVVPIATGGHFFVVTHTGQASWAIEDYLDWD